MSAKGLGSRAIIGSFYAALEQDPGTPWVDGLSSYFSSDQESETYKWLGQSPAMREWIGGRVARGFRENGLTIVNKKFEGTIEVMVDQLRRDKTGQIDVRIREMAERTNAHWASLLTTLIAAGEASVCYDGQFFFDTDHSEGDSGTQSNDLTLDITTPAVPTSGDMETAMLKAIEAIVGFKDDTGEPMNENARAFRAMVPMNMLAASVAALRTEIIVTGSTQRSNTVIALASLGGITIELSANARLTNADRFYMFRTDSPVAALIRQEEEGVTISAIAEGSEEEFKNDRHLYGVKAMRNVGYGYWQRATVTTFT